MACILNLIFIVKITSLTTTELVTEQITEYDPSDVIYDASRTYYYDISFILLGCNYDSCGIITTTVVLILSTDISHNKKFITLMTGGASKIFFRRNRIGQLYHF